MRFLTTATALLLAAAPLLAQSSAAPSPQKPAAQANLILLGRVVDATTSRPIPGALVLTWADDREQAALTNAAGQFVLDGLPAGERLLHATKLGYVDPPARRVDPDRREEVVLRLWKRGAITGRVVDERGEPIVGVAVSAVRTTGARARGLDRDVAEGRLRATTDDRGIYRIAELAPGDYYVMVAATQTSVPRSVIERVQTTTDTAERDALREALFFAGSTPQLPGRDRGMGAGDIVHTIGSVPPPPRSALAYRTAFYPSATTSAGASVITLQPGEERAAIDIAMEPVSSVRVSGRLFGADGPVAWQPVRLVHDADGEFATTIDPAIATSVTDAGGLFVFAGVPPGRYRVLSLSMPAGQDLPYTEVTVGVSGGVATTEVMIVGAVAPPRAVDSKARPVQWARLPVVVGDRDVDGLQGTARTGFRFRGRVAFEGTGTPPASGKPWLGLSIERADGRGIGFGEAHASGDLEELAVNERGEFETGTVPPGRYLLRVPSAPAGWMLKSAVSSGRDLTDDPLDVQADVTDVVLTFTNTTRLSGRVADASGDADFGVLVFPSDPALWTNSGASPHRIRLYRMEAREQFGFDRLPAGEYFVTVLRDPNRLDWRDPKRLQELSARADRVTIAAGENRTITLQSRRMP